MSVFKSFGATSIISFLVLISIMIMFPAYAADQTLGEAAAKVGQSVVQFKKLVVAVAYFLGTLLTLLGLWFIYKDGKEEGRGHMKNGFISFGIGCALLALPTMIGWTLATTGSGSSEIQGGINQF